MSTSSKKSKPQSRSQRKREIERKKRINRFKRFRALAILIVVASIGYIGYRGIFAQKIAANKNSEKATVETSKEGKKTNKTKAQVTELKKPEEMKKVSIASDNEKPVEKADSSVQGSALNVIERDGITRVHKSYSTSSEVLAELQDGELIEVVEALSGGWFKVVLPGGEEGYVESVRVKVDKLPKNDYDKDSAEYAIVVNQENQNLKIYHNGELFVRSTMSAGIDSEFTPRGIFVIDKAHSGDWDFAEDFGEGYGYYTAFYTHGYLLHSIIMDKDKKIIEEEAKKLGTAASHGCIRLPIPIAKYIHDEIPTGTVLIIE